MNHIHKGYRIEVHHDEYAENPRNDCNVGLMALDHKRYTLPWEIKRLSQGSPCYTDEHGDEQRCQSWDDVRTAIEQALGDDLVVILPVYGYQHSGFYLSTAVEGEWFHYAWDGGQLGWIVATRQTLTEAGLSFETEEDKAEIEKQLRGEVHTYSQFINGDVYFYVVKDGDGEVVDSCSGYYGYDACLEAAKEACE